MPNLFAHWCMMGAGIVLLTACSGTSSPSPSSTSSFSIPAASTFSMPSSIQYSSSTAESSSKAQSSSLAQSSSSSLPMSTPSSSSLAQSSAYATSSVTPSSHSETSSTPSSNGQSSSAASSAVMVIGPNLITNGDFSNNPQRPGARWLVVNQKGAQAELDWFEESAVLTVSAISQNWWETTFYSPNFTVTPGKRYQATATFVTANNSERKKLRFRVRHAGGAAFGTNIGEFTVTTQPSTKRFIFEAPTSSQPTLQAQLLFNLGIDEDDVTIDDVSVYEVGSATATNPLPIISETNLRYSQRFKKGQIAGYPSNHDANVLDVYRPDNTNVYPGIVLVHGGGWRYPGKQKLTTTAKELAAKGYVVANIHYQLSTPNTPSFPEAIIDVKSAIRWFRGNAERFNLDPQRIAGIGGSAGGNLIAIAAATADNNQFDGATNAYSDISDALQATIVLAGGMDQEYRFRVTTPNDRGNALVRSYLGITSNTINLNNANHLKRLRQASPIQHATKAMGPLLLIESGGDVPNPPTGRYPAALFEKLAARNIPAEYRRITNAKHSRWDSEPATRAVYMEEYLRFLNAHL